MASNLNLIKRVEEAELLLVVADENRYRGIRDAHRQSGHHASCKCERLANQTRHEAKILLFPHLMAHIWCSHPEFWNPSRRKG